MWQNAGGPILLAALIVLGFGVFCVGLWLIVLLIGNLLRLPAKIARQERWSQVIAALIALIIAWPLLSYLIEVVVSAFRMLPDLIDMLFAAAEDVGKDCSQNCTLFVVRVVGSALSETLRRLVTALQIQDFPYRAFILFLLVFAILHFGWRFLGSRQRETRRMVPTGNTLLGSPTILVHLSFLVLVLAALYLCLSALLAVPLMQTQAVGEGFSEKDLQAAIVADLPTREVFDTRFYKVTFAPPEDTQPSPPPEIRDASSRVADRASALVDQANAARDNAFQELAGMQASAIQKFRTQSAGRLGARETIDHFGAIYDWFQDRRKRTEGALATCLIITNSSLRAAKSFLDTQVANRPQVGSEQDWIDVTHANSLRLMSDLDSASGNCQNAQFVVRNPVPDREERGSNLKFVGRWTSWLLDTDSLPLVIIVGLVGFSLLGATISRVVRAGARRGFDGLGVDDLLIVITGGVAAALVVFLAGYGGLAVLSESQSDPNPYVVFVACLIGAIYSDDVWVTARARFRQSLDREHEAAGSGSNNAAEPENDPNGGGAVPETPAGEIAAQDAHPSGREAQTGDQTDRHAFPPT